MATSKHPPPVVVMRGRYEGEAGQYTHTMDGLPYFYARMYYVQSRPTGRMRIVNVISFVDGRRALRVAGSRQAYGMRGVFCIPCADDGFGNLILAPRT